MPERAFHTLVSLELRRIGGQVLRTAGFAAVIAFLVVMLGWMTPQRLSLILMVVGSTCVGAPLSSMLHDKLKGGLEFLVSLPVDRRTLAVARLASGAVFSAVGGVLLAVAIWVVAPTALPDLPWVRLVPGTLGISVAGSVVGGALGSAAILRVSPAAVGRLVLVGFFLILAGDAAVVRWIPGGWPAVLSVVTRPWFPPALGLTLLVLLGGAGWLAYALIRTGLERFTPRYDEDTL